MHLFKKLRILLTKKAKPSYESLASLVSGKRDLNPRLQPWQGCTLPAELFPQKKEAASGFEPENGGFADLCLTTWLSRLD